MRWRREDYLWGGVALTALFFLILFWVSFPQLRGTPWGRAREVKRLEAQVREARRLLAAEAEGENRSEAVSLPCPAPSARVSMAMTRLAGISRKAGVNLAFLKPLPFQERTLSGVKVAVLPLQINFRASLPELVNWLAIAREEVPFLAITRVDLVSVPSSRNGLEMAEGATSAGGESEGALDVSLSLETYFQVEGG